MRVGDTIYNLNGQPFATHHQADAMRTLLAGETGQPYMVELWPEGFVVRRVPPLPRNRPEAAGAPANPGHTTAAEVRHHAAPGPATRVFRPAVLRANLLWLPLIALGLVLFAAPRWCLAQALGWLSIAPAHLGAFQNSAAHGLALLGGALSLTLPFWLLTEWASAAYRVQSGGVEERRGLVAKNTRAMRFVDIRSIALDQSLRERLLNIGTLEFTSAGTDGHPIRFVDIARPARVRTLIQERIAQASSD